MLQAIFHPLAAVFTSTFASIYERTRNQNVQMLSNLVSGTNWFTVRVRVTRLWLLISQNANEPYILNMQFLDCEDAPSTEQSKIQLDVQPNGTKKLLPDMDCKGKKITTKILF